MVASNVIIIALDWIGQSMFVAVLCSFFVVVVIGYILHTFFTFSAQPGWAGFFKYAAVMSINIPISLAALALFFTWMGLPMVIAAPAATVLSLAVNYAGTAWSMRTRHRPPPEEGRGP
ncbi:MAG: GtrA family protein [Acetobacteraceae bacterium]|nr:GtrA family protein [Acetobacteraceae bacterium]